MTIDEIIEETTISFGEDIELEIMEDLLKHISDKLPANISYHAGYFRNFRYEEIGESSIDNGTVDLVGTIVKIKEPYSFDSFTGVHSNEDTSKFSALNFARVPGWEITEYRPEIRQLWKDIREIVNDYYDTMNKLMKEIKMKVDKISAN